MKMSKVLNDNRFYYLVIALFVKKKEETYPQRSLLGIFTNLHDAEKMMEDLLPSDDILQKLSLEYCPDGNIYTKKSVIVKGGLLIDPHLLTLVIRESSPYFYKIIKVRCGQAYNLLGEEISFGDQTDKNLY